MGGVVLNNALKATLLSLQKTSSLVDDVTLRLASGLKVNSALDNPQNFFTANALGNEASDLSSLLDGISQSIRAVELASSGLEASLKLIDQAEELAIGQREAIEGIDVPPAFEGESGLSNLITDSEADFYFRLDDGGTTAENAGVLSTTVRYNGGISTEEEGIFEGSNGSAYFDGVNSSVTIGFNSAISGNFTEKSVELVFNADSISGRQTIYSQGNSTRGFDIYLDGNELYITAINSPAFGGASAIPQPVFQATIESGRNYHTAIVFSSENNSFEGFLNGVSLGTSEVGGGTFFGHNSPTLGRQNTGTKTLHDGASSTTNFFNGSISDVAIYNDVLTADEIVERANAAEANTLDSSSTDYSNLIEQIQRTAIDANYRGFDLLSGKSLQTQFSANGKSNLVIEGIDIVSEAKSLPPIGFDDKDDLDIIIEKLRNFRDVVRNFAKSLTNGLNIIKIREDFTQNLVSTFLAGKDDLTLADQNEDGATLLALQTRQTLGVTAISLAAQSTQQTLRLF